VPRALAAALAVAALLAAPTAAGAHQRQESVFMDDNRLLYRGEAVATAALDELRDLGVDRVRLSLHWRAVAREHRSARRPPPAQRYDKSTLHAIEHVIRAGRARGIDVLVNVTGGAPLWATGTRDGRKVSLQYRPDPGEFRRFVTVVGRRLRDVDAWSIWNEPNQGGLLQPQWEDGRLESPRIYRALARAALAGLRDSGHGDDIVLLGETAPRGSDLRTLRGSVRPGPFLRALFCLDEDLLAVEDEPGCDFTTEGRFDVTGFAHHPYSIVSPPGLPHPHPDDMTLADRDRLVRVLDAAASLGRIPPELPLWYTEYGYQTRPPDPYRGVSLTDQAAWLVEAERLTFLDQRVASHAQFLLLDDVPRDRPGRSRWGTYQSGLRFADGTRKPAWFAYRLGLSAPPRVALGEPLRLWGFARGAPNGETARVQVEFAPLGSGVFVPIGAPLDVYDPRGYLEAPVVLPRSGTYRLRHDDRVSNPVSVYVE
jgi:hypothetical protein